MTPQETLSDIRGVITRMIEAGLSDEQRYPALRHRGEQRMEIYIEGSPDLSASMKDLPYNQIYRELVAAGAYNVRMIDGALIQMVYMFKKRNVVSHRLSFFPSPVLDSYEDAQDIYDQDSEFGEIVARNLVRFPIRFDFELDEKLHVDVDHPKAHMTLGQYKGCRIPTNGPLTPTRFIKFLVRNFYRPALGRLQFDAALEAVRFPDTITANERLIGHFVC